MISEFGEVFRRDIEKYYMIETGLVTPPLRSKLNLWLGNHGFHCVAAYRFGQLARKLYKRNKVAAILLIFDKILSFFVGMFYHVNISGANIAPGLYIGHVGTIYIGPTDIGENLSVTHNVTIGRGHSVGKEGVPKLGNNVWIGTGATIYGDIVIGNDVTIASGCVLSRDVPDGCLVGGNPGRIFLQGYDNAQLFHL